MKPFVLSSIRYVAGAALLATILFVGGSVRSQEPQKAPTELPGTTVTAPRAGTAEPTPPPPPPEPPPTPTPPASPSTAPLTTSGRTAPVENAIGSPQSASQGLITQFDLANQPLLRPAAILEQIPGLIVTQHSGILKANQYFLRGFSLDHGTDFAGFIDDIPWNLPTHAHGQGYLDLNVLIPELVGTIDFGKGPYYAQVGDFSSVGYASIHYLDALPDGIFKTEVGEHAWLRGLVADSDDLAGGTLLYGVEAVYYNAPYDIKEHANKVNAIFRWTYGDRDDGIRLNMYLYQGQFDSVNQIPQRAVYEGLIDSTNVIDPTDYGVTSRYTLNAQWWHRWDENTITQANVFGYYYSLSLYNDFTFFLQDPLHGDQIDQIDRRWVSGFNVSHQWGSLLFGDRMVQQVGVQLQNHWIPHVGLEHTEARVLINGVTNDDVDELMTGVYWINQTKWAEKVRTVFGLRGNFYNINVNAHDVPINSGQAEAKNISPKASLVLGPWDKTEFFLNGGYSYHSNDARSVVQQTQPTSIADLTPQAVTPAPLLVPSRGAEVGFRSQAIPNLTTNAALWYLRIGQELVFDGDTGTTEPLRASERYGIEFSNSYALNGWLRFDADFAATHARLLGTDPDTPGNFVPEAIGSTFSAGPSIDNLAYGFFAHLRFRYIGPRYLIEDASASSRATQVFELEMGLKRRSYTVGVELLNLFDSNGHDIDYFYSSALPSDPGFGTPGFQGVNDIHFRQLEPFQARFFLTYKF